MGRQCGAVPAVLRLTEGVSAGSPLPPGREDTVDYNTAKTLD